MNDNVLTGLTEICESIKELELYIKEKNNNFGVIKLIDIPKKLINVHIHNSYSNNPNINNNSFNKILENSLMKHAQIIQHFKINAPPITKILTTFVNLKELELDGGYHYPWNCLENLSLPLLQTLKTRAIPVEILASLIENTSGYLTKIKSLKRFLDNWKGRHPMFLQFNYRDIREYSADIMSLMKKYKAKGIIKEFDMHFE
ncbi:unnamed protein product [Rhizophagus irregularis]|nr:unnamed protein product [Rhizophagus irregularis]